MTQKRDLRKWSDSPDTKGGSCSRSGTYYCYFVCETGMGVVVLVLRLFPFSTVISLFPVIIIYNHVR